jgi:uncharacterized protein (DUF3084 family)
MARLTKDQKIIAGGTIAVLVIFGLWLYVQKASAPENTAENTQNELQNATGESNASGTTEESSGTANKPADGQNNVSADSETATSPKDTSDAAIEKDLSSIDSQINNLGNDSADIDKGLNDQPVEQDQ